MEIHFACVINNIPSASEGSMNATIRRNNRVPSSGFPRRCAPQGGSFVGPLLGMLPETSHRPERSVLDAYQIEPAGRGSRSRIGGAIFCRDDLSDLWSGERSLPDQKESSDEVADHVVQKSIAAYLVDQFITIAAKTGDKDRADIVRRFARSDLGTVRIDGGK